MSKRTLMAQGAGVAARGAGVGLPEEAVTPPFPSARYGSFPAACHYARRDVRAHALRGSLPAHEPGDRSGVRGSGTRTS